MTLALTRGQLHGPPVGTGEAHESHNIDPSLAAKTQQNNSSSMCCCGSCKNWRKSIKTYLGWPTTITTLCPPKVMMLDKAIHLWGRSGSRQLALLLVTRAVSHKNKHSHPNQILSVFQKVNSQSIRIRKRCERVDQRLGHAMEKRQPDQPSLASAPEAD
eukprot:5409895-Amphidinium_carterae.1